MTGGYKDMNKEKLAAIQKLVEKIPDDALEKFVGGDLSPKAKRILKSLGGAAMAALLTYGGYRLVKNINSSDENVDKNSSSVPGSSPPSYETLYGSSPPSFGETLLRMSYEDAAILNILEDWLSLRGEHGPSAPPIEYMDR